MNSEEIQKAIEGMLAVQRELQNSQLRFDSKLDQLSQDISELRQSTTELRESVADLREISQRHERRIEQLIGYSITGESDRIDIVQTLQNLERRVSRLENSGNNTDADTK